MPQRVFALPRQESLFPPAVLNPFVQEVQLTTAVKIRLLLVGSVLVPLRVLCLTVLLVLSWPLAAIATLCGPNKGTRQPIKGWRRIEILLLTLSQLYTNIEVEFLPPHVPTEEEKQEPSLFAHRVRDTMATALGVPVTDHTYEDCRLMISAGELTLPMEAGLVEFTKISRKLNLKLDNIKKELEGFAAIASESKGGRIRIEEFAKFLKLPISPALNELFTLFDRLFDVDSDRRITQEEFTSLLRSSLGVPDLDVTKLFQDIDADGTGKITYTEFEDFALKHPEYSKLFTTYLELQRHHTLHSGDTDPAAASPTNTVSPEAEDSASDKKED
ncbi:UNVERIFIED_CONTAM: hypothetical protein FKN15_051668 [Acipenser sinensis]